MSFTRSRCDIAKKVEGKALAVIYKAFDDKLLDTYARDMPTASSMFTFICNTLDQAG